MQNLYKYGNIYGISLKSLKMVIFMLTDVIIIGGGAAGLCAAVYIKQNAPELTVRIIEAQPRVGKKLALTGNGRCNITNKNIDILRYHGQEVEFCNYALRRFDRAFCEGFFEGIGLPFVFEGDKAFPASLQAASVVDCLRFAAEELGVITHLETKVSNIQTIGEEYKVIAGNLSFLARNVIIASGLFSGGERLGCDGSMLNLLKKAGFKTVKTTPAIVQLKTPVDIVKQLKGIKINGKATLKANNERIRTESGEILFCDYGLSGPPILQISREASRAEGKCEISVDIMPQYEFEALFGLLSQRARNLSARTLDEFFTGMLNKRLGQVILKLSGCSLNDKTASLNTAKIKKITALLKNFSFEVTGTTGFNNSQVTAGGLATSQFYDETMMSRQYNRLYAVGEILDIDGDCGGYNLQWAWSSAICAAEDIISKKD